MAPCDFILFALIKKTLRGKLFEDVETNELNATLGDPHNRVQEVLLAVEELLECVQAEGACFEGGQSVIKVDLILLVPQHQVRILSDQALCV